MNTQLNSNLKRIAIRMSVVLMAFLLLVPACARQPQPARVEEITFQSGEFTLVGELRAPGTGPFPVVLFVNESGPADRTGFGYYLPVMERMLRAGYAIFSWDRPGISATGMSPGKDVIPVPLQSNYNARLIFWTLKHL